MGTLGEEEEEGSERNEDERVVLWLRNRSEEKETAWTKKSAEIAVSRPRNGQGSGSTGTTTGEITERPEICESCPGVAGGQ